MNKLQLIDADTLYYKPLAHPKMLIDGVLSDGLAILAGDSKIGKSWMVLWLCLQISRGEAVWGLPTRKTDVVYLALEDREWRVQQRMQELTDSPPENLRFGFSCGQLGAELEGQIEETLREFPSTGLIFIDTLQMVRDNASAKVNAYAQDYKDLSGLKKLADDHGICIFVVHHTRKERDSSNILPSEKAFAYKMKYDALKHQGTSSQLGTKLRTDELLAQNSSDSRNQIQRYIRLTHLIPDILKLVDEGKIALTPAVELSYLQPSEQEMLFSVMDSDEVTPSLSQARRLRRMSEAQTLTDDAVLQLLSEVKGNQVEYVKVPVDKLRSFFRPDTSMKQMTETLVKAMDFYNKHLARQRKGRDAR